MAITAVYEDNMAQAVTSATSLSLTLSSLIVAGDLILISYFNRSSLILPSGYTLIGEVGEVLNIQDTGLIYKIADGSEAGSVIIMAQTAAGRMETAHGVYRAGGDIQLSQFTLSGPSGNNLLVGPITESNPFLAFCVGSATHINGYEIGLSIVSSESDTEFYRAITAKQTANIHSGRLANFIALYANAETTTLSLISSTTPNTSAVLATFIELTTPTLTLPNATGITATSAVPNVTVTF